MKQLLYTSFFLSLVTFTACDLVDDSPCGEHETADLYLLGSSIVDTTTGIYRSYMDGSNRVFQYSELVENVCPLEHVKGEFRVALLDETTTGISARADISWFFFFEERIELIKNGSDMKGNVEAGLKQAFDPDPGWFVHAVEVYFPTKGSYSADTAFLKNNVISVESMARYRHFSK